MELVSPAFTWRTSRNLPHKKQECHILERDGPLERQICCSVLKSVLDPFVSFFVVSTLSISRLYRSG
jgi:hypothetical protein